MKDAKKIRVVLAMTDLSDYGVQRVVLTLLKHWNREEFNVSLLLNKKGGKLVDQLRPEWPVVEVDSFASKLPKLRVISRILNYHKALNVLEPDVVISFIPFSNYGSIFAKIRSKKKFGLIVSEHAHVSGALRDKESSSNLFMRLYRISFSFLYNLKIVNRVKLIAEESRRDIIEKFGIKEEKTVCIHDPADIEKIKEQGKELIDHDWIKNKTVPVLVNVGRLANQKRQDILIKAFSGLLKEVDARLIIIGNGNPSSLRNLAEELGVDKKVCFTGFEKNPWKWMAKADLFVLSSMWEGLPCVITESMVLGIPVVSTKCPSGPAEMLLEGKAGYLCESENVDSLKKTLVYALTHKEETKNKTEVATQNLFRFNAERVTHEYETLVKKVYEETN